YNEADKILPGGHADMVGIPFNQELYDQVATATWATLNAVEPCLWRGGETYPVDQPALEQLYANQEVSHFLAYGPAAAGSKVDSGLFPESTRTYGLSSGQIGNTNFVTIPYNSPNKAAALVVADLMLSIDGQLEKAYPDVWGQINVLNAASQSHFADVPRHPSVVDPGEIISLGELLGDWVPAIEEGWNTNVAEQ
ncbi:MAG: ABC transporter substrate-binding protein, partial [bacterium]|nr:ABC transporter substrate-binding protein [bacterium]